MIYFDAYTHTHTEKREMESLPEALGRSAEQRQPPKNLHRETTEKDRGEELGPSPIALRPRQNTIPTMHLSSPFIAQGGRDVTTGYITLFFVLFGQLTRAT